MAASDDYNVISFIMFVVFASDTATLNFNNFQFKVNFTFLTCRMLAYMLGLQIYRIKFIGNQ